MNIGVKGDWMRVLLWHTVVILPTWRLSLLADAVCIYTGIISDVVGHSCQSFITNTHKHVHVLTHTNTHPPSLSLIWNNPRSPFNASQPPPLFIHLPLCCCSSLILSAFKITTEGRRQPPLSIQPPLWQTAAAFSQMLGLNTQIDRQIDR